MTRLERRSRFVLETIIFKKFYVQLWKCRLIPQKDGNLKAVLIVFCEIPIMLKVSSCQISGGILNFGNENLGQAFVLGKDRRGSLLSFFSGILLI